MTSPDPSPRTASWWNCDDCGNGWADGDSCPYCARYDADGTDDPPPPAGSDDDDTVIDESWTPVDLGPVLAGEHVQPVPDWLLRNDGRALLYPGAINAVHGDSGAGKGWIVCFAIVEAARRKRGTVLVDFEDTAVSITARLQLLGMAPAEIERRLVYIRPQTAPGPHAVAYLCELVAIHDAALVVIDSIGEAFACEGLDENKDVEVGPWYRRVARPLADMGAAVLLVDHSTKAADNPLHPSGSKRKRAAITGASYFAEATTPFVKGEGGRIRLTCAKDRHGNYRRGEVVGNLAMTYSIGGTCHLELYAPDRSDDTSAGNGVVLAAQAAVKAAKDEGVPLSRDALCGRMAIKCRADLKRGGIDLAVARGALTETAGSRGARLYQYLRDMTEDTR